VRLFSRHGRSALRPLGEAEAYARCHGDRGDDILAIERMVAPPPPPPPPPPPEPSQPAAQGAFDGLTGEMLRRAFEVRLAARRGHESQ
jgi:hypothetical protein